jgi:hypothetical protein
MISRSDWKGQKREYKMPRSARKIRKLYPIKKAVVCKGTLNGLLILGSLYLAPYITIQ